MGAGRDRVLGVAAAVAIAAGLALAAPAQAADSSPNVRLVANLREDAMAISLNFIGKTMFVSTVQGLYSYDVSNPAHPALLGFMSMPIWENEDMDVDPVHRRVFLSRDPRGFTGGPYAPGQFPYGAVHIIDVSDPRAMKQVKAFLLPAGHTTTCVNRCSYIWTAGPSPGLGEPSDWKGRPVFGTDVRDPNNPKPCPAPIDTGRNDGTTDYAHDVQVDPAGVAWVSGRGGIRGYWTQGRHLNPVTGKQQTATACRPVPYAGGGSPISATPSRFMHNSWRDPRVKFRGHRGRVLYATEENVVSDCNTAGRLVTYDLGSSLRGQGWKDIAKTHFRMKVLDTWTPHGQPGSTACDSAHYLADRGHGIIAQAFYGQGTRFLDLSDPRHIRQIGWYRPADTEAWEPYWHDGYVYVADLTRGVDVLRFQGGPASKAAREPVSAPKARGLPMDPRFGGLCPMLPLPSALKVVAT